MKLNTTYIHKAFFTPAIYIHELSHVMMCILLFVPILEVQIDVKKDYSFVRFIKPNTYIAKLLINMSPFLVYIGVVLLCALNAYFTFALLYLIFTYKVSLPSKQDFDNIKVEYEKVS